MREAEPITFSPRDKLVLAILGAGAGGVMVLSALLGRGVGVGPTIFHSPDANPGPDIGIQSGSGLHNSMLRRLGADDDD